MEYNSYKLKKKKSRPGPGGARPTHISGPKFQTPLSLPIFLSRFRLEPPESVPDPERNKPNQTWIGPTHIPPQPIPIFTCNVSVPCWTMGRFMNEFVRWSLGLIYEWIHLLIKNKKIESSLRIQPIQIKIRTRPSRVTNYIN